MTRKIGGAVAVLAAAALVMSGCGDKGSSDEQGVGSANGQGGSGTGQAAGGTEGVDLEALDTGPYPTEPAPPFGRADDKFILDYEGQRMAEYVLAPFEVEPTLTDALGIANVLRSSGAVKETVGEGADAVAKDNGFLVGYDAGAKRPDPDIQAPRHELDNTMLRFSTPEGAAAAAQGFADAALRKEGAEPANLAWGPVGGGARPHAVIRRYEDTTGPKVVVESFAAQGDRVFRSYVTAPGDDEGWAKEVATKSVEQGLPLMAEFPARPTNEQVEAGVPAMPPAIIDQDAILVYAIPEADEDAAFGDDLAVYGPRGMSHRSSNPPLDLKLLTEVGAEHTARGLTSVYRASDEAGAERIVQEFLTDARNKGRQDAPPPPGLPIAHCLTDSSPLGRQDTCLVRVGRYVGEVQSTASQVQYGSWAKKAEKENGPAGPSAKDEKNVDPLVKKDVDRLASAQYLILTKADQNKRP